MKPGDLVKYKPNEWMTEKVLNDVGLVLCVESKMAKVRWCRPSIIDTVWESSEDVQAIKNETR